MKDLRVNKYKELLDLDSIKATKEMKQARGRQFEDLINDILEDEKIILKRGYHTSDNKAEQIDGAIEIDNRIFLLEVKWVESNLAASELFAFIGKVDNKFQGTLGIFLSKEELSNNFINALNKGRRQNIIVIHGEDVDKIFEERIKIADYIKYAFRIMSYDNVVHLSIVKYLKISKSTTDIPTSGTTNDDKPASLKFLKECLIKKQHISEAELILNIEALSNSINDISFELIIRNYHNFWYSGLNTGDFTIVDNCDRFLKLYSPTPTLSQETTIKFYTEILFESLEVYSKDYFIQFFSSKYNELDEASKTTFAEKIADCWKEYFGSYDAENHLTRILESIWDNIQSPFKTELISYYMDIFMSTRLDKFPQKSFAISLLYNKKITKNEIEEWLDIKLKESKEAYDNLNNERIKFIAYSYSKLAKFLNVELGKWVEYIAERMKKIA